MEQDIVKNTPLYET